MKSSMRREHLVSLKAYLEKSINEPRNDTVSRRHLRRLDEARNYDAASSYNYLFGELMVIKHAVSRGRVVTVETTPRLVLDSNEAFMRWALDRYPAFKEAGYHDLYVDPVELIWTFE